MMALNCCMYSRCWGSLVCSSVQRVPRLWEGLCWESPPSDERTWGWPRTAEVLLNSGRCPRRLIIRKVAWKETITFSTGCKEILRGICTYDINGGCGAFHYYLCIVNAPLLPRAMLIIMKPILYAQTVFFVCLSAQTASQQPDLLNNPVFYLSNIPAHLIII